MNKARQDKEAKEELLKIEEEQYRRETLRQQAIQEEQNFKIKFTQNEIVTSIDDKNILIKYIKKKIK